VARIYIQMFDDAGQGTDEFSNGFFRIKDLTAVSGPSSPQVATLAAIAPNPFRSDASIQFRLPQAGDMKLSVIDIRGAVTRTLLSGYQPAGEQRVRWDGRD